MAKKGTKMRVKDEVLTLSENFLAFFKSNQDFDLFKVQAARAPRNSTRLMTMKSCEKAETCNWLLFCDERQGGEYGFMEEAAVTHRPPVVQRVKRGRVLRDSILLPMQGPENAHCLFALAR